MCKKRPNITKCYRHKKKLLNTAPCTFMYMALADGLNVAIDVPSCPRIKLDSDVNNLLCGFISLCL